MKRTILGIVLATLAMFFWGFLYWGGVNPLPFKALKHANDDVLAGEALLEHFPERGSYFLPAMTHEEEARKELYSKGPVAFVHMLAPQGRPMMDMSMMAKGFLLNFVVVILFALLLKQMAAALPSFADRARCVVIVALIAAVLIDVGDTIWWMTPITWKIHQIVYDFSTLVVAGLILAKFITADGAHAEKQTG